jgi:hypothetical protein
MAGTPWNSLEKAILVHYNGLLVYDKHLRTLLQQHAGTGRTLMAIRSKLAELKNQPTLYDKKLRKWTSSATQDAAGTWSATQDTRLVYLTQPAQLKQADIPQKRRRENRSARRCTAACMHAS